MPFFGQPKVSEREKLESLARVLVRAGFATEQECVDEVARAAAEDAREKNPVPLARELVESARTAFVEDANSWPEATDYDRLQAAFSDLNRDHIAVLQSIEDHWEAQEVLRSGAAENEAREGVVWFTAPDVWHAVEHGMLEVNVWHSNSANILDDDPLLEHVLGVLARHGIDAHFDEGRVEVSAYWHRRPGR